MDVPCDIVINRNPFDLLAAAFPSCMVAVHRVAPEIGCLAFEAAVTDDATEFQLRVIWIKDFALHILVMELVLCHAFNRPAELVLARRLGLFGNHMNTWNIMRPCLTIPQDPRVR